MASIEHPQLKTVFKGVLHRHSTPEAPVNQFRGIKYANLYERWRLAEANKTFAATTDATKHGPACPQLPFGLNAEDICIGISDAHRSSIDLPSTTRTDEFEALNLVINTPRSTPTGERLPVLVWVHGGGCEWGHNSAWFTDGGSLVARSLAIKQPIVFVTINYRLSVLGWSTSDELGAGDPQSPTNGIGNYGLHDAHLALEWVYRYIEPFGGDPHNITVGGESGGAAVVRDLMNSALPARYSRAIMQSVAPLTASPRTLASKSVLTEGIVKALGAASVDELRTKDPMELLGAYFMQPGPFNGCPTIDGVTLKEDWESTFTFREGAAREILIGDNADDGTLWYLIAQSGWSEADPGSATEFLQALEDQLGADFSAEIQALYGISSNSPLEQLFQKILSLIGDVGFIEPTDRFADAAQKYATAMVYRYAFSKRNPFAGPLHGTAGHALDLVYLFGNEHLFNETEQPEKETRLLHTMQDQWIGFVRHGGAWASVNDGQYLSIGPDGTVQTRSLDCLGEERRLGACKVLRTLQWEQMWQLHQLCLATMRSHIHAVQERPPKRPGVL